jgi:NitT/TauT family transport system permease protein
MGQPDDQGASAHPPLRWGSGGVVALKSPSARWVDAVMLLALAGLLCGILLFAREWRVAPRPTASIDLSLWSLPRYTLLSAARGLAAYVLSFFFAIGYGYWAAKDRVAGRLLLPLLDVLQSIPVLGFMPGVVLALVATFPHSNVGLELAAVLMIFTGQVWNMTFSFYHSLKSVPVDLGEAATMYRFSPWARLRRVELPFAAIGLVWNSMMSMAGGWFFLMISEAFVLGDRDFRLPGLGSYMSVAASEGNARAMVGAVVAMTLMIVTLDQLLWRPAVVWAQKFRTDDTGQTEAMTSWFLDLLRSSQLLAGVGRRLRARPPKPSPAATSQPSAARRRLLPRLGVGVFLLLLAVLVLGAFRLVALLAPLSVHDWLATVGAGVLTLGRVLLAVALGTLWTVPAGLAIGLSPRLSRVLQPVVQVVASFPAPMLFPAVIVLLNALGVPLGWGSILLMILGTQWYVLFNVVAGATAIPADLREAAQLFRMGRVQRFRALYLPAVFPYLVTGWVTAAGGAWNASIVSEYVTFRGQTLTTHGLGAVVSEAAAGAHFHLLAASILVMAFLVVAFNRLVWRRLGDLAERRFALTR